MGPAMRPVPSNRAMSGGSLIERIRHARCATIIGWCFDVIAWRASGKRFWIVTNDLMLPAMAGLVKLASLNSVQAMGVPPGNRVGGSRRRRSLLRRPSTSRNSPPSIEGCPAPSGASGAGFGMPARSLALTPASVDAPVALLSPHMGRMMCAFDVYQSSRVEG